MKRLIVPIVIVASLLATAAAMAVNTYGKPMAASSAMKQYLVSVPHTPAECLSALDDFKASKALDAFEFGCLSGDHTGYRIVSAKSMEAALAVVPEKERARAKAIELHKFTAGELQSLHEKMAKH